MVAIPADEVRQALIERGLELYRQGKLADAECVQRELLAVEPENADALHLLGLIARRTHRSSLAVELLGRAIKLRPSVAPAHFNLGNSLVDLGDLEEAVGSYDKAIALRPTFVEALVSRGFTLLTLGRPERALADFDRVLAVNSELAVGHHGRAAALIELELYLAALHSSDRAGALVPGSPEPYINRAAALRALARPAEALESCERALGIAQNCAQAQTIRGACLIDLGRPAEALNCFDAAIAVRPEDATAHAGRGSALQDLQMPAAALASFERAIALRPQASQVHNDMGIALGDLGRSDSALASFARAIDLRPSDPRPHLNSAHIYLRTEQFEQGWNLYEWRFKILGASVPRTVAQPLWQGDRDIAGKTLFVHSEQGLGDTIQFCRYAVLAEQAGARVIMSVQNSLRRLLTALSPTLGFVPEGQCPEDFDLHCPLLSMPRAFGTSVNTVPAMGQYLFADPERVAQWRARYGGHGFKIGICWQGGASRIDIGRSFPLASFQQIATLPGVHLLSLQKGPGVEQLESLPAGMSVASPGDNFDNDGDAFMDSAAIMQNLDLVITSDTAVAHLAGALGRPTWVALKRVPDWRWLLGRADSPWYPAHRLFRQDHPGAWQGVFEEMYKELSNLAGTGAWARC